MTPAERAQKAAFSALAALPPGVKRLIAGPPHMRDGLTLDLDAQLILRLERLNPRPPIEERGHVTGRADMRTSAQLVAGRRTQLAGVSDTTVADLPARLYTPRDAEQGGPLVLYFHGGGWVVGDLDSHDAACRTLANAAGTRVLSVDYRLAPEHPWPQPVDDARAAFQDAQARADRLGVDPQRIAVAGDSAGAHLATMVALGGEPAFQLLVYPATDLTHTYESARVFAEGYLLTKRNMDWYEEQFAPAAADKRAASPLHADLENASPALVITAGFDPLRDEGEAYAAALRDAGVRTVLRRHPGQVHGFFNMTALQSTREAIAEMAGALRAAL